jgi:hypothetical protein
VITWIILSGGAFLCLLSLAILRQASRYRRAHVQRLRGHGMSDPPMLLAEAVVFAAWGGVFVAGCGLLIWGWIR